MFSPGQHVFYKKYHGIIKWYCNDSTYMVTLYKYHGMDKVDRRISENELEPDGQVSLDDI